MDAAVRVRESALLRGDDDATSRSPDARRCFGVKQESEIFKNMQVHIVNCDSREENRNSSKRSSREAG